MGEKVTTRTAQTGAPSDTDLLFLHVPSGISLKWEWSAFKALMDTYINQGGFMDFGGANQVSAADIKVVLDGLVNFVNPTNSFTVSNAPLTIAGQSVPSAGGYVNHPTNGYLYSNFVQDIANLGGGYQVFFGSFNFSNGNGLSIIGNETDIEISAKTANVVTAAIKLSDGKVFIETPEKINGTVDVGALINLKDAATGEIEYIKTRWETATRPSSPTTLNDGFNVTLSQREYWNGTAWVQY